MFGVVKKMFYKNPYFVKSGNIFFKKFPLGLVLKNILKKYIC